MIKSKNLLFNTIFNKNPEFYCIIQNMCYFRTLFLHNTEHLACIRRSTGSSQPDESEIIVRKGGSHIHISKSAGFMDSKDDPIAYHVLNQKIKVLIRNIFEENFKPIGFRQNGQNFRLYQDNGLCKIVNFQKYRYNHNKNCSLTVNIGLYFEKDTVIQNRNFYESDCQVRIRPSHEYYGEEKWWPVNDDRSLEQFTNEIRFYFENTALPWLNQFGSREDVIAEMLDKNSKLLTF